MHLMATMVGPEGAMIVVEGGVKRVGGADNRVGGPGGSEVIGGQCPSRDVAMHFMETIIGVGSSLR